jgi:sulfopyruvate decarboxylase TPP-binding subunit
MGLRRGRQIKESSAMDGQLTAIPPASPTLAADAVLSCLKRCGVTHLVWLPDSESAVLYELVKRDRDLTLVQVCREGESFGVAAGLIAGGKKPVVVIQSTGFFESGDSVRGLALWLRLPLLMLVGYRGWQPDGAAQDTAAHFLEPILRAWQIDHVVLQATADIAVLETALRTAEATSKPTAVLIAGEWG